jgi:hypothetical protein
LESFEQAVSNGFTDLSGKVDSFEKSVEEWILPGKIFNGKCQMKAGDFESTLDLKRARSDWLS